MPPKSRGKRNTSSKTSRASAQTSAKYPGSIEKIENVGPVDRNDQSNNASEGNSGSESSEKDSAHDGSEVVAHSSMAYTQRQPSIQAQRSQSYGPATFAPPFYNRPPTPLPPSPSLTSLLRPLPFAAPLSRTTTPESSDTEATGNIASSVATLNSTEAAVAQSAQAATTVPRASPKVPTYEYYGFVLYIGSSAAFLVYLLWSYLPAAVLHKLGIYYYPNRWWSLAIPAWLVVLVIYIYVALAAWNTGHMTLPLSSLECLVDDKAQIAVIDEEGDIIRNHKSKQDDDLDMAPSYGRAGIGSQRDNHGSGSKQALPDLSWRDVWDRGTDGVMDIPIGGVCEVLYGSESG